MNRSALHYLEALAGIAAIAWLTSALLPVLGLASSALLFLLPVLLSSARGGVGPGLLAALAGAAAYNFFLLPPRFTFQVHQVDNLISVGVLAAVALVTSRLANRLVAREAEASQRARLSEEAAALSAVLAASEPAEGLSAGTAWMTRHYGAFVLVDAAELAGNPHGLSPIELSAAAWSMHNGDVTGHGSEIMPASGSTFLPLAPKLRREGHVAALCQPSDGSTRSGEEIEHLKSLCLLIGQARDRAALDAVRRERELLAQTDQLRQTMLASLAHDFRTPLTVISGRLELLAKEHLAAREALQAAHRLNRTMTNLLGAARIEGGTLVPQIESIDLVDAVSAACEGLEPGDGKVIERAIPADLPFVAADPVLLHHILVNLLDNAVRHARQHIGIGARATGSSVELVIEDDGLGIPEAERERVFERFRRIEGSDRSSGSGLGLAIVRGFADVMDMNVALDQGPAGGARFTLKMACSAGSIK